MNEAVMLSNQLLWCELIGCGAKLVEFRKSAPKTDKPFTVFMYEAKTQRSNIKILKHAKDWTTWKRKGRGKVIGKFTCTKVEKIEPAAEYYSEGYDIDDDLLKVGCLSMEELMRYGKGKPIYAWHISDYEEFDEPRDITEFYRISEKFDIRYCAYACKSEEAKKPKPLYGLLRPCDECKNGQKIYLTRAPQSWCFVEAA